MKKFLKGLISFVLITALVFSLVTAYQVHGQVTNLVDQAETKENEGKFLAKAGIDKDSFLASYDHQVHTIKNEEEDYFFPADSFNLDESDEVFVILHGLGGTGMAMAPFDKFFLDQGYGVLTFDQRNSGSHPIAKNNMGVKEKDDLIAVVDFLEEEYPDKEVSIYAQSYAANSFLFAYPQIKSRVKLVILDSPMSDGKEMVEEGFHQAEEQTKIPYSWLYFLGNLASNVVEDYSYEEMNGLEDITVIDRPILIISNENDDVIPYSQAQAIYDKSGEDRSMVLTDSKHAEMALEKPQEYMKVLQDFLGKYDN